MVNPAARSRCATVTGLSNGPSRRSTIGTNPPENDGGGSAIRTGARGPSRAFNSEYVDIQNTLYPTNQAQQHTSPKSIGTGAVNVQAQYSRLATHDFQRGQKDQNVDSIRNLALNQITRLNFETDQLPHSIFLGLKEERPKITKHELTSAILYAFRVYRQCHVARASGSPQIGPLIRPWLRLLERGGGLQDAKIVEAAAYDL